VLKPFCIFPAIPIELSEVQTTAATALLKDVDVFLDYVIAVIFQYHPRWPFK
jgi:hypothetical protein